MKTRFIVETKILSNTTGAVLTVEHGLTYDTIEEAATGQIEHVINSEHTCVGFRIIELREVEHDDH